MEANEVLNYKKGEIIFCEGEFGMDMFDILDGEVSIYSKYGTPEQKLLTTLKVNQFFGEMGLIEAMPRSATAVASDKTVLRRITSENFGSYFQEKPSQILAIMQNLSGRLRELSKDYLSACQTISEYLDAEEAKQPKSESLIARMKKFVRVYKSSK